MNLPRDAALSRGRSGNVDAGDGWQGLGVVPERALAWALGPRASPAVAWARGGAESPAGQRAASVGRPARLCRSSVCAPGALPVRARRSAAGPTRPRPLRRARKPLFPAPLGGSAPSLRKLHSGWRGEAYSNTHSARVFLLLLFQGPVDRSSSFFCD